MQVKVSVIHSFRIYIAYGYTAFVVNRYGYGRNVYVLALARGVVTIKHSGAETPGKDARMRMHSDKIVIWKTGQSEDAEMWSKDSMDRDEWPTMMW